MCDADKSARGTPVGATYNQVIAAASAWRLVRAALCFSLYYRSIAAFWTAGHPWRRLAGLLPISTPAEQPWTLQTAGTRQPRQVTAALECNASHTWAHFHCLLRNFWHKRRFSLKQKRKLIFHFCVSLYVNIMLNVLFIVCNYIVFHCDCSQYSIYIW